MGRVSGVVTDVVRNLRGAGFGAVREFCWRSYLRYARRLSPDPVFEADWDLLVVLDACRADLWAEVVAPDGILPVGTTRISPGGTSTEWLDAVFGGQPSEALSSVGYVTANPYSTDHVDGEALGYLREVWRDAWDDDLGTVPPRAVTDAAIRAGREQDLDRLVVHYMQPHFPSIADDRDDGIELDAFGDRPLSVWEDLRFGRRSRADVWEAYRANLRAVLDDVELLLNNVDAERAVITADHGNAFGERGVYGHAAGLALRPLREVPWAVTAATDGGGYEPPPGAERTERSATTAEVTARLERLGYR
ncbi:hypothetical protein [Natronomonas marina]|jgi:hypothetical protein|uniref:hypothetical protein n=1 Tax=Natronomonas marina TaxID=2961939 RepID=UPI0020C95634|nr:hypothetical protein [Natronomonas marina]